MSGLNSISAEIRKIPPVTRFLVASTAAVTLPALMQVVSPYTFLWWPKVVFSRHLQIWRIYTAFFLSSGGIQFIFDLFQLYRLSNELESGPYGAHPANYAYQLVLTSLFGIIPLTHILSPSTFFRPLLLSLATLSSELAPVGSETSLMGLVSLPRAYLPYIMLLFDLLLGGPGAAALALGGVIVGHCWAWGIWGGGVDRGGGIFRHLGVAPGWLVRLIGGREGDSGTGAREGSGGVRVMPPRRRIGEDYASGAVGQSTGHRWGSGQRLGRN